MVCGWVAYVFHDQCHSAASVVSLIAFLMCGPVMPRSFRALYRDWPIQSLCSQLQWAHIEPSIHWFQHSPTRPSLFASYFIGLFYPIFLGNCELQQGHLMFLTSRQFLVWVLLQWWCLGIWAVYLGQPSVATPVPYQGICLVWLIAAAAFLLSDKVMTCHVVAFTNTSIIKKILEIKILCKCPGSP